MSVDILGTSCDQCRSMVQYSFTSTETRRLVRTDSPGRPPRLSHSSWNMSNIDDDDKVMLMSSDVSWHIKDKLWPMPKHGSIILYVHGKLQLNEGKTEALLVATSSSDKDLPISIKLGSSVVPFVKSVRNLGVILDWRLSMKVHIIKVCQIASWELRRISSIRQYLTEDAATT